MTRESAPGFPGWRVMIPAPTGSRDSRIHNYETSDTEISLMRDPPYRRELVEIDGYRMTRVL